MAMRERGSEPMTVNSSHQFDHLYFRMPLLGDTMKLIWLMYKS